MRYLVTVLLLGIVTFASNAHTQTPCSSRLQLNSSQVNYFKNLVAKGSRATIEEFFHLWHPDKFENYDGAFFLKCQAGPAGKIQQVKGFIPDECAPEVLYSWGNSAKLQNFLKWYGHNGFRGGPASPGEYSSPASASKQTLFTTLSPVATFSYGDIPIRIRLRVGTRFSDEARGQRGSDLGEVGYYSQMFFQDFNIFDFQVVDSWSFGSAEQYDEIIKDIWRISSGKQAIGYRGIWGNGLERVYNTAFAEYGETTELALKEKLLEMAKTILNGEGRVFYRDVNCGSAQTHFVSTKSAYFNR